MALDILQFQGSWRTYQARVLDALEGHLDDDHLHVVAAPGSGKTILGLEVLRRLGKPTLVLAPTITIRNQWVHRLTSMFLETSQSIDSWVTKDIRNPKTLTFVTYQALHAALAGEQIEEEHDPLIEEDVDEGSARTKQESLSAEKTPKTADILKLLKEAGIETIVLDEAHHLRKEWWHALTQLKATLKNPTIVSLTATPPYDVDYAQWERYEALCGPIDTEISVPELVKHGDLCPHQDYIYFSLPTAKESEKLRQFKGDIETFLSQLRSDSAFLAALSSHPWIQDTQNHIEDILDAPEFFSAYIIYLHAAGFQTPGYAFKILGIGEKDIPPINAEWLEVFLTGILYTHADLLTAHKETLSAIRKHLKSIGAIEKRKVIIDNTKEIKKLLASSLAKLDSIVEIAQQESYQLKDNLRMVVLADYIRLSALPDKQEAAKPVNKIGVVPIFEYLRQAKIQGVKLGILTGSIVVIPKSAEEALRQSAVAMKIPEKHLRFMPMSHDSRYLHVNIKGESRQKIVHLITEIFNAGHITTLVGTQALLGEGWDATSVNTLVLASHVGSFMLSNQMRGRAIRIDPKFPNKTANVWHLVAIDIETMQEKIQYLLTGKTKRRKSFNHFEEIKQDLGHDLRMALRRFQAFEGLSYNTPITIESGLRRLSLAKVSWNKAGIEKANQNTMARATDRARLPNLWAEALQGKSPRPAMREKLESNYVPRGLAFADTLKYLVMNALVTGGAWGTQVLHGGESSRNLVISLGAALAIAAIYAVPKLLKALYLLVRNGSIEGSLRQAGWAVLETLQHMALIKTNIKNLRIDTAKDNMGVVYCRLSGATNVEKKHFLEAMKEVLGPIQNPRYVLVRRSFLGIWRRIDYHNVPKAIATHKKSATFFHKKWSRYVGNTTLVYTRNIEGRAMLLKARTRALSTAFIKKTKQISIWE